MFNLPTARMRWRLILNVYLKFGRRDAPLAKTQTGKSRISLVAESYNNSWNKVVWKENVEKLYKNIN